MLCDHQISSLIDKSSSAPDTPWQVLHVRSNAEKRVAQYLSMREVEAYLPLYRERVKWTDRTMVVERPLFTGYVFTRYSAQTKLRVITTPGVVRSLGEEEHEMVSSTELDKIQAALTSGYPLRPHPRMVAGMRVRVRTGVFEGVIGTVTELRQQCKVVMALSAVRQCFSLEQDVDNLELLN